MHRKDQSRSMRENKKMKIERYHMKTRGIHYKPEEAIALGIRRIYNYTSDIGWMNGNEMTEWSGGLYQPYKGEAVIVESAMREVSGEQLYVMSCIVFHNIESCNLYFFRHCDSFAELDGFLHLYN